MDRLALISYICTAREKNNREWMAYYLSKAGQGEYEELLQLGIGEITDRFEADDWTNYQHDYELEEAVEQGIGYDIAMAEILQLLEKGGVMTHPDVTARLEYLRGCVRAERMSWGELAELQSLAEHIEPGDVELLEWAGVPEFPEEEEA